MKEVQITLRPGKEKLELCEFMTISGVEHSGGMAKREIQSGHVLLNDIVETRKRKKLQNNDIITYNKEEYKLILNAL